MEQKPWLHCHHDEVSPEKPKEKCWLCDPSDPKGLIRTRINYYVSHFFAKFCPVCGRKLE